MEAIPFAVVNLGSMTCTSCNEICARRGPVQKYCEPCSTRHDLERKRLWASNHPAPRERASEYERVSAARTKAAGIELSRRNASSITWTADPDLAWLARISYPFTYGLSKNGIFAMRAAGHVALRREAKRAKAQIAMMLRSALRDQVVKHNKVWLDILVQKTDHKGDAVNFVDLICDAVKLAIPVDDRWYCIRRLDWEVVKSNPKLFIGIGQEEVQDASVCSSCGRILELDAFPRHKGNKQGVSRNCRECLAAGRVLRKKESKQ